MRDADAADFRVLDALMRDDEILFRVGIGHLLSVGYANLTEEAVSRTIEEIEAEALTDEEVELRMISPAYQVAILRMAAKIREVPLWTLLKYISKKVKIS